MADRPATGGERPVQVGSSNGRCPGRSKKGEAVRGGKESNRSDVGRARGLETFDSESCQQQKKMGKNGGVGEKPRAVPQANKGKGKGESLEGGQ